MPELKPLRFDQLTFTRFLAAVSIVIFHFGRKTSPFDNESISFLFSTAHVGVSYFFVLSGFVMIMAYYHYDRIAFWPFLKRRLLRLYPLYIAAFALFIFHAIIVQKEIGWLESILQITMLHAWVPNHAFALNTVSWSLSVELFFYLTFPFLINRFYKQLPFKTVVFVIIIFWLVSQVIYLLLYFNTEPNPIIYVFPLLRLNEFLIGNVCALFFFRSKTSKQSSVMLLVCMTIFIVTLRFVDAELFNNGLLAPLFGIIILVLAYNQGRIKRLLNQHWLIFLGNISYGIYILQLPVFEWTYSVLIYFDVFHIKGRFFVALFMLLIAFAVSYVCFERPLMQRFGSATINKEE